MQVAEAFVSGSLGQAIYREDGIFRIIDDSKSESRDAFPNEVQWFRHAAREIAPAHPEGLPVSIDIVRVRLEEEIRFFSGLDGLLVGMDRDFSEAMRRRAVLRAENILAAGDAVARRIRHRFLIPANTQEWDPAGGLALALRNAAKVVVNYYRPLAEGVIDRLSDDINAVLLEKLGGGVDAARARDAILRSRILAELALVEARADRSAFRCFCSAVVSSRSCGPSIRPGKFSRQLSGVWESEPPFLKTCPTGMQLRTTHPKKRRLTPSIQSPRRSNGRSRTWRATAGRGAVRLTCRGFSVK
jgi:hypothetical protein